MKTENFADYILNEEEIASKLEIVYYLSKKRKIFFDKSVVFKFEIARLFLNYSKIEVDNNFVLTASLLCNCKKSNDAQDLEKIHAFAKEGAEYLSTLGFGKKFCKICQEVNRYSNSNPREKESDILELVDQFGGMLLDRPERIGFNPDEALVLLEHRNLKDEYNRYLNTFMEFIDFMEEVKMNDEVEISALRKLIKIYNETEDLTTFIKEIVYKFEPNVDRVIDKEETKIANKMFGKCKNPNRPLFSEETTRKIMSHINDKNISEDNKIAN